MSNWSCKKTKRVSVYKVAMCEAFKLGIADYRAGNPFRDINNEKDAVNYERGRHFAALYAGRIYQGRGLNWWAKSALDSAVHAKWVF